MLKHDDGISFEIGVVIKPLLQADVWMLFAGQPADVSKKEAALRVVWISIRVRVLVVDPMTDSPRVHGVLTGHCLSQHQEDAERQLCLKGSVAPVALWS